MKQSKTLGLFVLIALTASLLLVRYEPYILQANHVYYQIYGDGFKNYATILYHVKQDSSYLHYGGMNYPYGEHVMFTDGQPILSNTIKWISRNVVDISDYTVAIINIAPILSFLLCSMLLYLIFVRLELPVWYSILVATALAMFSPQTYRLVGHYALSYAFVIPAILYFLLRFEAKPAWKWSIFTSLLLILSAQFHFYFFGIGAMLIAFYFLFHLLRNFSWLKAWQLGLHFGIQVIVPFVFLQIWLRWSDHVPDRPAIPLGFLGYHAHWEGIMTSNFIPYWDWLDKKVVDIRGMNIEGEAYVGIVAVIFFLVLLFRWGRRKFQQAFLPDSHPVFLKNLFPAAFIILLLSLGLPFTIPGLDFLVDYVGPYRQFRGQGRFAWVFYYGWNIITWYSLFHIAKKITSRWQKYVLLSAALLLLSFEAYHYSIKATPAPWQDAKLNKTAFENSPQYWFKNIDISRYQAVLPLPYYHVGSENMQDEYHGDLLRFSLIPGLHYKLPSMGVWLSRTSYEQTLKMFPITLLPYRPYRFLEDLPSEKPLLIVLDKAQFAASKRNYGYLLRFAKPLYDDELMQLFELEIAAFDKSVEAWKQDVENGWQGSKKTYVPRGNVWLPDSTQQVLYMTFDSLASEQVYQGKGALELPLKKRIQVFEQKMPAAHNTCEVWVYLGKDQYARINFKAWEIAADRTESLVAHNGTRFDLVVLDNNGWGLVQFPINLKDGANTVRFELECREMQHSKVFLDELLIRPTSVTAFWERPGWLAYNNLWFPQSVSGKIGE